MRRQVGQLTVTSERREMRWQVGEPTVALEHREMRRQVGDLAVTSECRRGRPVPGCAGEIGGSAASHGRTCNYKLDSTFIHTDTTNTDTQLVSISKRYGSPGHACGRRRQWRRLVGEIIFQCINRWTKMKEEIKHKIIICEKNFCSHF